MRREDFIPTPPNDEVEFMRGATVVLDTNVLLGLYRLSAKARNDALGAIESVSERLWLPHQVAVEFYRNQPKCRDERRDAYAAALGVLSTFVQAATKPLGAGETHRDVRVAVAKVVAEGVEGLRASVQSLLDADAAVATADSDDVLARIEAAFAGRVATEPEPATVRARVEEFAEWRQPNFIPPGYRDDGKPDPIRRAADYLIWAEVLEHVEGDRVDVLLVTNDAKSDWWETLDGVPRPHQLLVREYARASSGRYHQVSLKDFVGLVAQAADREADEDALEEIEAVAEESRADEERARVRLSRSGSVGGYLASAGAGSLSEAMASATSRYVIRPTILDQATLESLSGVRRWTLPGSALAPIQRATLDSESFSRSTSLGDIGVSSSSAIQGMVGALGNVGRGSATIGRFPAIAPGEAPSVGDDPVSDEQES